MVDQPADTIRSHKLPASLPQWIQVMLLTIIGGLGTMIWNAMDKRVTALEVQMLEVQTYRATTREKMETLEMTAQDLQKGQVKIEAGLHDTVVELRVLNALFRELKGK